MILSHFLLNLSLLQGGMLRFIIAAVSPAVVVPEMFKLKEKNFGKRNEIPSTILAAASIDDVVAITLFKSFWGSRAVRTSVQDGPCLWYRWRSFSVSFWER
ncbi:hypothetical protein V512_010105 [Mesotoga sp. Brook.08.105.5.1]|nr:hypothetical protein V512_010105 [Mesotoga sp. Brook.08.105.5.1]RAO98007.1 hypothetical protein M388_08045 [Mesotoga sp. Brook.08.YT.4.2.5.4.]